MPTCVICSSQFVTKKYRTRKLNGLEGSMLQPHMNLCRFIIFSQLFKMSRTGCCSLFFLMFIFLFVFLLLTCSYYFHVPSLFYHGYTTLVAHCSKQICNLTTRIDLQRGVNRKPFLALLRLRVAKADLVSSFASEELLSRRRCSWKSVSGEAAIGLKI